MILKSDYINKQETRVPPKGGYGQVIKSVPFSYSYRLITQLGCGTDGVSYRGLNNRDQKSVKVWIINGSTITEKRYQQLDRRLGLMRLISHASVRRVLEMQLDATPPYIVMAQTGGQNVADVFTDSPCLEVARRLMLGYTITSAVAAAHDVGLTHGALYPRNISLCDAQSAQIDFTGVEVYQTVKGIDPSNVETAFRAPEVTSQSEPQYNCRYI